MLRFLKLALIFELSTILGLSVLTGQFFYRAYNNSSREHLPVSFLAALVMLVLGTQQTAMSFRREKVRLAYGRPTRQRKASPESGLQHADPAAVHRRRSFAGHPQKPSRARHGG